MRQFKKIATHVVEGLFALSGSITSLAILLIVLFLFKEGMGLFQSSAVETGYVICINASNPVEQLTPVEIKEVFNWDITDWKALGGKEGEIVPFRFEEVFSLYSDEELGEDYALLPEKLTEAIVMEPNIIACVPQQYAPEMSHQVKILPVENIKLSSFLSGEEWMPTAHPAPQFGALPLIMGTLWISLFAILIALPLGLGVSIFLAELASEPVRKIVKPAIELLAGIPSVVYGFFGLAVIVPLIQRLFALPVGETAFTGSIILAIMALPTIITIAEDAMRNTPATVREASLGLGATRWQTIYRVVIPCSASGISAAVILGIGRAIGETMAVLMVTGNAAVMLHSLFEPARTVPATIAAELGEAPSGGAHYQSLFMLGCILFVITMIISILAEFVSKRKQTA
ncbi:MAG: phosphate ABC transporter permease subunit PstC [Bacteroidales bacterium]|jgi:phosphate transport system permease protein|nr:phosphate ABC transporter permease subunit PstC [Bacteroidales bacterium]